MNAHADVLQIVTVGLDDPALQSLLSAAPDAGLHVHPCATLDAGLQAARGAGCDAVLVPPRFAGGSGNALLGTFKREVPSAVRLLLLEDGRDALGLAAVENLHRALYRPLDPGAVRDALRSVRDLRDRLQAPGLAEAIGRVGKLPPPPALTLELLRRTEAEDVTARELAELVERDPALAAKVLRLCNSALYSGGRSIRDIRSAIVLLGTIVLRRLVMAGEVFGTGRDRAESPEHQRLREQSLRASRLAGRLLADARADVAATAALIANVGHLIVASAAEAACPPSDAGAYLLALWGLPDVLVQAAAWHATPALAGERGLDIVGATHVAWALLGEQPLDEAWLDAQGLTAYLPLWRGLADEIGDLPAD